MSGKNKLVPRLLGVTKESIVRVDERTKDVGDHFSIHRLNIYSLLVYGNMALDSCQTMDCITQYIYISNRTGKELDLKINFLSRIGFWRLCKCVLFRTDT